MWSRRYRHSYKIFPDIVTVGSSSDDFRLVDAVRIVGEKNEFHGGGVRCSTLFVLCAAAAPGSGVEKWSYSFTRFSFLPAAGLIYSWDGALWKENSLDTPTGISPLLMKKLKSLALELSVYKVLRRIYEEFGLQNQFKPLFSNVEMILAVFVDNISGCEFHGVCDHVEEQHRSEFEITLIVNGQCFCLRPSFETTPEKNTFISYRMIKDNFIKTTVVTACQKVRVTEETVVGKEIPSFTDLLCRKVPVSEETVVLSVTDL